jgi:hypothetical protein
MGLFLDGYGKQNGISNRLPMPVDVLADTAYLNAITGETLQLYYWSTNVLTTDAGEAAGTMVLAKFAYTGILDAGGVMIGNAQDTSIAFTTGTVLTTEVPLDYSQVEAADNATLEEIATDVTANMDSGEYAVDYRNGVLYGLKATTGTSDTVAYKVSTQTTGGGTSIASTVKLTDGTDILDVLVQDSAYGTASKGLGVFGKYMAAPTTYTDGDATAIATDVNGRILLGSDVQIGAVEIKDGTTDARQSVKVDNATASATPTVALAGGIYKDALDTYDDNDAAPLHTDVGGQLLATVNGLAGSVAHDSPDAGNPVKVGGRAVTSQIAAVANNDRTDAVFNEYGEQINAGYTYATTSNRVEEVDPLNDKDTIVNLVDTTNVSAATHYYPSATGASMDGYKDMSLSGKFIDADGTLTLTVEMMNDEDTSGGDWVQVYGYDDKNNATVNSWTVTNGTLTFSNSFNNANYKYYRIAVVASGATNTVIVKERKKAL